MLDFRVIRGNGTGLRPTAGFVLEALNRLFQQSESYTLTVSYVITK
jgi:hypothetical protein